MAESVLQVVVVVVGRLQLVAWTSVRRPQPGDMMKSGEKGDVGPQQAELNPRVVYCAELGTHWETAHHRHSAQMF